MKTILDLGFKLRENFSNSETSRYELLFDNGYGLSAIQGLNTYSGERTYEIAVIRKYIDPDSDVYWDLCYNTPITNNVLGFQTLDQIKEIIEQIKSYKEDEY